MKFLFRSYSLLRFHTYIIQFCLLGPLIVFIYILSFKPFGLALFDSKELLRIATYLSLPVVFIWALHLYLIRPLIIKRLTILNTVLMLTWINVLVGMYNYTFTEIYLFDSLFDFYWLPSVLWPSLSLGASVSIVLVISHAGWLQRRKLIRNKKFGSEFRTRG